MAPILATTTGVTPQVLDDIDLRQLLSALNALKPATISGGESGNAETAVPLEIEELSTLLEPWHEEWHFEEQVDLHEWIHPLNVMDAALTWILNNYGHNILLLDPIHRSKHEGADVSFGTSASSLQQINECPEVILNYLSVILQFTSALLRNSMSKALYASVPAVADLLAAADDTVADSAVSLLAALSLPPSLHKQQAPEHAVHTTALHKSGGNSSEIHDRLTATARAWGTRAIGLGLHVTVTADDSVHGQGGFPAAMGQVSFGYYQRTSKESKDNNICDDSSLGQSSLHEITLSSHEMLVEQLDCTSLSDGNLSTLEEGDHEASNKRRRVSASTIGKKDAKPTAELFFAAIEKAGGKENVPPNRMFSLLADIRLARSFHSQATRIQAVQRRLHALIAILHAHPSHEIMSGYFQAQPELTLEIVDLLRPTVSVANVSSASTSEDSSSPSSSRLRPDAIANLASSSTQNVPYNIRMSALEALTALVARRDTSTSTLSGPGRLSNVLIELGVGKGQYLGLLPTLIRYSLAALNTSSVCPVVHDAEMNEHSSDTMDVGLAFAEITMAPPLSRRVQVERAMNLIDNVLTLTSSVVGTPSGTPALVDCGLIPALLSTVSMDPEVVLSRLMPNSVPDRRLNALFRFVTAQAVQILEGAIVSHNNALSAFHDLQGVEILTARLAREISCTRRNRLSEQRGTQDADGDVEMKDSDMGTVKLSSEPPRIVSSQRVLLFSIVTCLTVVFHQESSSSTTTPSGGSQLRKKELTESLIEILDGVQSYGGHLASLISTLLSDVLNNDPHIVHYVHESGIAKSFINMIKGRRLDDGSYELVIPPVPELVMAIPNVISALSLTEDGAKAVQEANPFPSMLRIFHHPNYAMPKSRCLLNEMTAIVGTGLDEIMRHVERLKPLVLSAVGNAMTEVVKFAEDLFIREGKVYGIGSYEVNEERRAVEDDRSCLIQYVLNFGQLLEQILHNEEHCEPFVEVGGLDALLKLFPASMPCDTQFLAYLSSLSSPSVSTLHHSTTEETLSLVLKCIEFRYDSLKLIRKLIEVTANHLDAVEESQRELLVVENPCFVFDQLPSEPFYKIPASDRLKAISRYLRNVTTLQWITTILANAIKAACQRNNESGTGWNRSEREWKKELSSKSFEDLVHRLSTFYRASLFEVCRARTTSEFEKSEATRLHTRATGLRYRLRIACPEGAVVRDGIEIDSCADVGSMEMGDIVDSFDRCINSSGILRYRTNRGWVSEMTRGHGREPISEVISIYEDLTSLHEMDLSDESSKKRIEAGIPSLRSVAIGILARGQASYADFFGSLSKLALQGVRSLPGRAISFEEGSPGAHVASLMKLLASNLKCGFAHEHVAAVVRGLTRIGGQMISEAGAAMYLGCYLSHAHVCLFDDRRETRLVNFTLLVSLLATDPFIRTLSLESSDVQSSDPPGLFDAIRFVFIYGLSDFAARASIALASNAKEPHQRVGRSVAASYPPLLGLLRKLMSTSFSSSASASIMSRIKWKDIPKLLGDDDLDLIPASSEDNDSYFCPESFVADLQVASSRVVKEAWTDPRMIHAPPYLLHPIATLVDEIMMVLLESSKKKSSVALAPSAVQRQSERVRLSELTRLRQERRQEIAGNSLLEDQSFEPSEEAITQLMEMGFSRDHALDALESTNSNQIETAMDYALSNPPPSPSTVERRRAERAQRAVRRSERQQQQASETDQDTSGVQNGDAENTTNIAPAPGPEQPQEMEIENSNQTDSENQEKDPSDSKLRNAAVKKDLASWIKVVPEVACSFMASMHKHPNVEFSRSVDNPSADRDGDGENEALTVVLCSFLLDLCHRYPESRSGIVSRILGLLKSKLTQSTTEDKGRFVVLDKNEACVASLCHATVLIARALPKTRLLVLKEGLVNSLLSCIKSFVAAETIQSQCESSDTVESKTPDKNMLFPMWLAPSLLLLDLMAQPIVAFSDEAMVKSILEENPDNEFLQVQAEHKEQVDELLSMTNRLFAGGQEKKSPKSSAGMRKSGDGAAPEDGMDVEYTSSDRKVISQNPPLSAIPAYFPLLSHESSQDCLEICQKLLGANQDRSGSIVLPPGIAHSILLLLLRLLRAPKISSKCLQMGVAEAILSLPKDSTFTGNTGLVTLIFRRLLEDESTLQSAMETEIRAAVTKLVAKKNPSASEEKATIALPAFTEAVMPLLCRSPSMFLKAMAMSVSVECTDADKKEPKVSLLTPTERSQRMHILSELPTPCTPSLSFARTDDTKEELSRPRKYSSGGSKSKNKLPNKASKRQSFTKKGKKEKSETPKGASHGSVESPATHVTCLIINAIVGSFASDLSLDETESFLWTGNLLEILADLVLAVPACASAVHNFRPHRGKDRSKKLSPLNQISHALVGCPPPPKTFVTFLLHSLLPQDRWTIRNDPLIWDRRKKEDEDESKRFKMRKRKAYRIMKTSQAAARVLIALVIRPGEGRKRVISDLVFALSGGHLGHGSLPPTTPVKQSGFESNKIELEALHAWGELCLGLIAPRSNGKNLDATSSLSIDNVRLMLEYGMSHALLFSIHRVKLYHPMASSSCGALLLPLEILTRPAVSDAVRELVSKDNGTKESETYTDKRCSATEKHSYESFTDTAFGQDPEHQSTEGNNTSNFDVLAVNEVNHLSAADSLEGLDDEEDDDEGESEDDEISSSEESDEPSDDDEEEESEVEETNEEEEHSEMEDSEEGSSDEVEEEGGWDLDFNDTNIAPDNAGGRQEFDEVADEGTERIDENLDEGWTRIESTGFGGMMLSGRRGGFGPGIAGDRHRGFIDAAETMIGTLLRNGDISSEALAEIEGTLGIRIMSGGRSLRATLRTGEIEGGLGEPIALRVLGMEGPSRQLERGRNNSEVLGTLPHIHQRSQPDVGYSAFGRSGQSVEISSMEYVYGGPSVTGGSRNYDLNTPFRDDADNESHLALTQLDLHLFPGGPASAASARTQHSLHPLLCGVDLPPINSLVSDLLPHGVRATRRGQMTTRRPGDFSNASFSPGGYLVSTSNGNIIRSNRSHAGGPHLGSGLTNRNTVGPVGWTDDGLPVDATVEEFSTAFERALVESARTSRSQSATELSAPVSHEGGLSTELAANEAGETIGRSNGNEEVEPVDSQSAGVENPSVNPPDSSAAHQTHNEEQESVRSDGDRVASSLAAGLRLSPGSEESVHSEQSPDHAQDSTKSHRGDQPSSENVTIVEHSTNGLEINNNATTQDDAVMTDAVTHDSTVGLHPDIAANQDSPDHTSRLPVPDTDMSLETGDRNSGTAEDVTEAMSGDLAPSSTNDASDGGNGLVCPPDVDPEVFNMLPREMQQECVEQYMAAQELADQLDGSSLDPAVLAELPPEMRREIIEQERRERLREQEQARADPAHAEDMDIASFIASLSSPELREEILITADETVLNSLPPNIQAEAQILRERASQQRRLPVYDHGMGAVPHHDTATSGTAAHLAPQHTSGAEGANALSTRRKPRSGKLRVEADRVQLVYTPDHLSTPFAKTDMQSLLRLLYLLSPVRPPRLLQKLFQNLCMNASLRSVLSSALIKVLHEDGKGALEAVNSLENDYKESDNWRRTMDSLFSSDEEFPPSALLGAAQDVPNGENFNLNMSASLLRRKEGLGTAASMAANLPKSAGGFSHDSPLPPIVASRVIETILHLCKSSPRFCLHTIITPIEATQATDAQSTCFEKLLELLDKPMYSKSAANLDQLLMVLEAAVTPLSHLSKHAEDEVEISQREIDSAAAAGKELVDVPRITVSQSRLQLLCSILRMETCRDTAFTKVNTIVRRLCRIESNRGYVLAELASVAHALGVDAIRDLRALRGRMDTAVAQHPQLTGEVKDTGVRDNKNDARKTAIGTMSSSITLSTSTSELKLLRVLQTLQALCNDGTDDQNSKKNESSVIVTEELVHLLRQMQFDDLWDELTSCLKVVQILEGVRSFEQEEQKALEELENNDEASGDENGGHTKKLRNSAAGLLTRFLPSIEAFFIANASATRPAELAKVSDNGSEEITLDSLVGGKRLEEFVISNKVLLNALVRNNPVLLDKGLRALVQVPRCRTILDFDVKRHWFKTQMRRLRQQAARRHGSLRLVIRRKTVFEDAYHQLRLRNADEMRGRLHITFRNEEGVDAGGLSREFFGILAKEIFNPNYALFTSTEDGCTFQPNPNSSINPDHLSYFRFVGRIVGKAVADSFLLDAHFTRSLYKHMLGLEPTHHDMEAIDPDYYRNLKTILEYDLADIGLDLTFSIQDNSFGRSQVIDLIPNGRNIAVTEDNKEEYVRKVCQHRMTTAIKSQIKAYLDGFYELVNPELIAVFTPRELELLISGLPDIDLVDLKKNTDYVGWKATDKEIEWFWNVLFSLSRNEKAAFLQFVTGSSKVPLAGFSELQGMRGVQKFSIHKASGSRGALMSAHTCFNSLDLPVYSGEEEMREKLLYAINEGVDVFLIA